MRECRTFFVVQTPDISHIVSRPGFGSITAPGRTVETAGFDSTIGFPTAAVGCKSEVDADNSDFTVTHTVGTGGHSGALDLTGGTQKRMACIGIGFVVVTGCSDGDQIITLTDVSVQGDAPETA